MFPQLSRAAGCCPDVDLRGTPLRWTQVGQQIRFCTAPDGVRLAYAVHGSGPPIVRAATWLTHLDFDWESPVWRHWLAELGDGHTVVRYDERGCGLSDRELGELSVDTWVADLETVVDAAGARPLRAARRLAGRGDRARLRSAPSRARHAPRPLRRLRARPEVPRPRGAHAGGGADLGDPRRLGRRRTRPSAACSACCSSRDGTPEQMAWYDELQRRSTSAETAGRLCTTRAAASTWSSIAPRVTAPTLSSTRATTGSCRSRRAGCSPRCIPGAAASSCSSRRTTSCSPDEPAWRGFLSRAPRLPRHRAGTRRATPVATLSPRELEVLELVADGPDQRGDRRAAVPQRPHGRAAPLQRLREAARLRQGGAGGRRRAVLPTAACRPPPRPLDAAACRPPMRARAAGW